MDILDIDEALKDDSFICLEDKTHDDVSNILQQWKSNNCMLPPQYQQEQAYKLNSRTFTRPRRKSSQNLDTHFSNVAQSQSRSIPPPQSINLEIGGLVTNMHKSFLQDTSPPSSICSSMDVSIERMNNSLITSADFTNINFLQSTQSLDFNEMQQLALNEAYNLADKSTSDGYTLSDMIRDRKALESLTMSGDGTLIKDSHIAQIDDISLAFSKTTSACSTMDNSTESVEAQNQTTTTAECVEHTPVGVVNGANIGAGDGFGIMHRTMLLSDDIIGDTTFDLAESSLCSDSFSAAGTPSEAPALNLTHDVCPVPSDVINGTFKKPQAMNETICLPPRINSTFDCQMTPEANASLRCETPENMQNLTGRKFYESTPQTTIAQQQEQQHQQQQQYQYTPSAKLLKDDANISPIVASREQLNPSRVLSETFDRNLDSKSRSRISSHTFSGALPRLESIELLENVENPNETYDRNSPRTEQQRLEQSAANIEMQNVLDLAQAEEELLASNNDQEFEDMLEEFSKVEMNAEHTKMKRSLETLKRRFAYGVRTDNGEESKLNCNGEAQKSKESLHESSSEHRRSFLKDSNSSNSISSAELKRSMQNSLRDSQSNSSQGLTMSSATTSSSAMSSGSGERLLSRRSRLYDNINLSHLSAHSPVRTPLDASYTVQKAIVDDMPPKSETDMQCNNADEQEAVVDKTEHMNAPTTDEASAYKLAEKRERDRERFKTKVVTERETAGEVKVPCIDDDDDQLLQPVEQHQDGTVFNNNKSETEAPAKTTSKINPNYLTYKKPRDKQQPPAPYELPEVAPPPTANSDADSIASANIATASAMRARSRSRPRYISGLQKFNVVKATSASDLDTTTNAELNKPQIGHLVNGGRYSRLQPLKATSGNNPGELKSPMGTKSKSFHNLSSNFGYGGGTTSGLPAPKGAGFGLKKPSNIGGGSNSALNGKKEIKTANTRTLTGAPTSNVQQQQQSTEEGVFKVPRLVSGLRAPAASGVKRAGLVRPSSGYYSLNVTAKAGVPTPEVADLDAGRHSPTDSMSSASSRGSAQSNSSGIKPPVVKNVPAVKTALPLTLTKITTGATGIPKPSGLRPPSTTVKRSGLPKPAGIARR